MSNKYLVLGMEGDFQAYGTDSKYYIRDTDMHPSKSAVIGMILSSTGKFTPDMEFLGSLTKGYMEVEAYRDPWFRVMTDFHMMGSGHDTSEWDKQFQLTAIGKTLSPTKMSWRKYLTGVRFKVVLELPEEIIPEVVDGLRDPVHGPFLGRKCCIPSAPVFRGVASSLEEARGMSLFGDRVKSFTVKEGSHPAEGDPNFVNDVPVKLGYFKEYSGRYITVVR